MCSSTTLPSVLFVSQNNHTLNVFSTADKKLQRPPRNHKRAINKTNIQFHQNVIIPKSTNKYHSATAQEQINIKTNNIVVFFVTEHETSHFVLRLI